MIPDSILPIWLAAMALLVAAMFVLAVRHVDPARVNRATLGVLVLLGATAGLGRAGALSFETRPPTMMVALVALLVVTVVVARSELGRLLATGVPIALLVGYQAFRVPVELWLHSGYDQGIFPVQMTYSGLNFDIVSGITAAVMALLLHRGVVGRRAVAAWNVMGLALLLTIVTIALLSAPLPFQLFTDGPANVYVTGFPGIWLPAVLVQAALLGHLLVFRWLANSKGA